MNTIVPQLVLTVARYVLAGLRRSVGGLTFWVGFGCGCLTSWQAESLLPLPPPLLAIRTTMPAIAARPRIAAGNAYWRQFTGREHSQTADGRPQSADFGVDM